MRKFVSIFTDKEILVPDNQIKFISKINYKGTDCEQVKLIDNTNLLVFSEIKETKREHRDLHKLHLLLYKYNVKDIHMFLGHSYEYYTTLEKSNNSDHPYGLIAFNMALTQEKLNDLLNEYYISIKHYNVNDLLEIAKNESNLKLINNRGPIKINGIMCDFSKESRLYQFSAIESELRDSYTDIDKLIIDSHTLEEQIITIVNKKFNYELISKEEKNVW